MLKDGQAPVFRCVDKYPLAHHFKKQQYHAALLWKILHIHVYVCINSSVWIQKYNLMQTCKLILMINIHYDIKWECEVKVLRFALEAPSRPSPSPMPPASRYKSCTHPAQ